MQRFVVALAIVDNVCFHVAMRNAMFILGMIGAATIVTPALADVPPPDTTGCTSKVAGNACQKDDMSEGTCADSTCTKLDYSMGTPPKTVEYACLKCTSGGSGSSSSGGNGSSSSGGTPSDDDGGCSMKSGGVAGAAGAWILGAAVLMFARRTRARKRQP